MSPDEIISDRFRGALSMEKKWKQIISFQGFRSKEVSRNDCQRGSCCKEVPYTLSRFHVVLNFVFIDMRKIVVESNLHNISYRLVKSPTFYLKPLRNGR